MKTFSLLQQKQNSPAIQGSCLHEVTTSYLQQITESNQYMSDLYYLIVDPLCGGCYETDCSILQNESILFKTVADYKQADYLINCFTKYCLIIEDKEVFNQIKENYYFLR